ncbi:MAG TPA: NADH-quinone oxidoreductase subunit D, partial [Anaerolineaceae bacterium]
MSEYRETTIDELRHLVSNRALTGETMLLNMGPQHPSTHGVLRLLLELDGEIIVNCIPDIGYLHTGIEKNMESKTYQKAEVMVDRLDYLNPLGNNLVYCMAVEKLCEIDVPERAEVLRVILTELTRLNSHLVWLGTDSLDLAAMSTFLYTMREREIILDIFEMCSGQRMMTTYNRPGGLWRDVPAEFNSAVRSLMKIMPDRIKEYESLLTHNPLFLERTKGIGIISGSDCLRWGVGGPI